MLLSRLVASVARQRPGSPALTCGTTVLSYAELDRASRQVARAFQDRGLQPGDRVAVLARPCHWFAVVEVGTIVAGGILVPVFPRYGPSYINDIVAEADPTILCYSHDLASIAEGLDAPSLRARFPFDADDTDPSIERVLAESDPVELVHDGAPDDVALIIYTSGTSGRPKGVTHAHRNWTSVVWRTPQQHQGWVPEGRAAVSWNIYHASGQAEMWLAFFRGWRVTLAPPLAGVELADFIHREALTHVLLGGATFKDVIDVLLSDGPCRTCATSITGARRRAPRPSKGRARPSPGPISSKPTPRPRPGISRRWT